MLQENFDSWIVSWNSCISKFVNSSKKKMEDVVYKTANPLLPWHFLHQLFERRKFELCMHSINARNRTFLWVYVVRICECEFVSVTRVIRRIMRVF